MFVLIAIANQQGIDLDAAFQQVLAKYSVRDADRWTRIDADSGDTPTE
jgi:hypothetical protein